MNKNRRYRTHIFLSPALVLAGCLAIFIISSCNPFAPKLGDGDGQDALLGDQRTVEGLFTNFRYAYLFRDTLIYGQLLAPEFTFIFRDYDEGRDVSWGRDEDMRTTFGMFRSAQNIELVWNEVIINVGDSLASDVSRGFTLSLTFDAGDIIRVDGRVNLRIQRPSADSVWKIVRWRDESNY